MLSDYKEGAALKLPSSEGAIAMHAIDQITPGFRISAVLRGFRSACGAAK